ncbi:MAG: hypothetical protein CMM44_04815 [Rhodospirillaceae bacterium]|nr:hypothetical protein [Rhodospirillaceae bacterium]|tara:strand:- start:96 stop:284 length:189 start_codon:yes stop_codon:yes gene_type:complete
MQIPRYVTGAIVFAFVWAIIVYINEGITDLRVLAIGVAAFIFAGSCLSWLLTKIFEWYRKRR